RAPCRAGEEGVGGGSDGKRCHPTRVAFKRSHPPHQGEEWRLCWRFSKCHTSPSWGGRRVRARRVGGEARIRVSLRKSLQAPHSKPRCCFPTSRPSTSSRSLPGWRGCSICRGFSSITRTARRARGNRR